MLYLYSGYLLALHCYYMLRIHRHHRLAVDYQSWSEYAYP